MRLVAVGSLLVGCSCPKIVPLVVSDNDLAVSATVYTQESECGESSCARPAQGIRVRISSEARDYEGATDANGTFQIPVEPGSYSIELIPPRSPIDRSVGTVEVTDGGVYIERSYDSLIEPDEVTIAFAETTAWEERVAILESFALQIIGGWGQNDVVVRVEGRHPQEVGEALALQHKDVVGFSLATWACPH
jgi:hypothetical protein